MKISKKTGAVIEWIIAAVLITICAKYWIFTYGSFTAIKAHEQSEKTFHYGPSQVIKIIDLDGGKIYLCRYKDWFSADNVKKGIIKWYPGDGQGGYPIDYSKKVTYCWSGGSFKKNILIMKVYGFVNDSDISQMVLEVDNNNTINNFKYSLDKSRMFIFYWNDSKYKYKMKSLKGFDKHGNIIYEEKFPQ